MTDQNVIIEVEDIHRYFKEVKAVCGVSFKIHSGQVVGFVGANGAGKTTTMRIMAALDLPDSGNVRVCGYSATDFQAEVKQRIGWMPDHFGVYQNMTVMEYLDFFARAYGFFGVERSSRLKEVIDYTDLGELSDRYVNTLSKGMTQRLCLGRILLHDPQVLILDEPAAGLDPKARIEFRHLMRLLSKDGMTIFLSSHILTELEDICDEILFIDQGSIVHHGSTESLKQGGKGWAVYHVQIGGDPEKLAEWIAVNPEVKLQEVTQNGVRISFERDDAQLVSSTLKRMLNQGIAVVDFHREKRKLEDAFIEILEARKEH